jgi:hypothetical protein
MPLAAWPPATVSTARLRLGSVPSCCRVRCRSDPRPGRRGVAVPYPLIRAPRGGCCLMDGRAPGQRRHSRRARPATRARPARGVVPAGHRLSVCRRPWDSPSRLRQSAAVSIPGCAIADVARLAPCSFGYGGFGSSRTPGHPWTGRQGSAGTAALAGLFASLPTAVSPHWHPESCVDFFRIKASYLEPRYGIEP